MFEQFSTHCRNLILSKSFMHLQITIKDKLQKVTFIHIYSCLFEGLCVDYSVFFHSQVDTHGFSFRLLPSLRDVLIVFGNYDSQPVGVPTVKIQRIFPVIFFIFVTIFSNCFKNQAGLQFFNNKAQVKYFSWFQEMQNCDFW